MLHGNHGTQITNQLIIPVQGVNHVQNTDIALPGAVDNLWGAGLE